MKKQLPYERVPVASLKLDPRNARKHDKKNLKAIKDSLLKFGQQRTIVVTKDNVVIAGNGTVAAAKELGWETIDITRSQLTGEDAIAYGLVDNRASELAEWDDDNLKGLLSELNDSGWDLEGLGWDNEDLEGILEAPAVEGLTDEDDVPEVEQNVFGVKLGDIWQLGSHRLMCGDSTSREDVERLMNGEKADMVFTDPPYNIAFKPQRGTHDIIANDDMSEADFRVFLLDVFTNCKLVLKENSYLISFMGWPTIQDFNFALKDLFEIKSMPVWVKNNFGIGYYTRPKYEPFYLCLNGKPDKPNSPPADVFEYAKVHKTIHSCEKPVEMIIGIASYFNHGGLFYEPFLGSGSTLIACEKTGRKCYGMELDPHYCSVIIKRWQDFTGKEAVKL